MAANCSSVITDLLPALVASSTATLVWWTTDELYGYANECANDLAKSCLISASADQIPTVFVQPLPEFCLGVIEVASFGECLPQTNAAGLDAFMPAWRKATAGEPTYYAIDTDGPGALRLFPAPTSTPELTTLIYRARLPDATASSPVLNLPACLAELLWWSVLEQARDKDGKGAMPDVAQAAHNIVAILTVAARDIWTKD